MEKNTINELSPEEIIELLMATLSECNNLVAVLGKKTSLNQEDLRKLRNHLMFARAKARHLGKALENMKRPVDSFKFSS